MLVKVMDQMQPEDYPQCLECMDCTIEAQLMRRGGYSPNQLVFGRDPEFPGDDLLDDFKWSHCRGCDCQFFL